MERGRCCSRERGGGLHPHFEFKEKRNKTQPNRRASPSLKLRTTLCYGVHVTTVQCRCWHRAAVSLLRQPQAGRPCSLRAAKIARSCALFETSNRTGKTVFSTAWVISGEKCEGGVDYFKISGDRHYSSAIRPKFYQKASLSSFTLRFCFQPVLRIPRKAIDRLAISKHHSQHYR